MADGSITCVVASVATICDADARALYDKLKRYAIARLKCDECAAHDLAADTLVYAIERGWTDPRYAMVQIKRIALDRARAVQFKADKTRLAYDDDNEPLELVKARTPSHQDHDLRVQKIVTAIEALPEKVRATMRLIAMEWTHEEIASELGIATATVRLHAAKARRELQRVLGDDCSPPPSKFKGVEKQGRQYRARLVFKSDRGWKSLHVGLFETAKAAALAYDEAARNLLGAKAKTNFA